MAIPTVPTLEEVRSIFETAMSDQDLGSFINDAHVFVTHRLENQTLMGNDEIRLIVKYVAAHFASVLEPQEKSVAFGEDFSAQFQVVLSEGLGSTAFGQRALLLDRTGNLSTAGKKRARFRVHGFRGDSVIT